MSWDRHHSLSETLASEAEAAARNGDNRRAHELYRQASTEEASAFEALTFDKQRTRGVTAGSAVALRYKAGEHQSAEHLAYKYLLEQKLPPFAQTQLREMLQLIWTARAAFEAGTRFIAGDVLVSVKGGEVIHGAAPLDLIIQKIESIQAVLFRTVEMLLERPLRRRGGPERAVQSMFRPWLVQAPAGSYQFAVRVEEPRRAELWKVSDKAKVEQVTSTFFSVLRASAADPERELAAIVPDDQYREAFLNLSRNLAPSPVRRSFERLEVRDATSSSDLIASFAVETRQMLNAALRKFSVHDSASENLVVISGILRALQLDKDWLEIATDQRDHVRIDRAGDVLDDVIGPMVNHKVQVTAVKRGQKHFYRDIELDE